MPGGMFDDWTLAQKKRFSLSGLCGLVAFVVLYGLFANLFPLYFPSVDDHLGAVIGWAICVPTGLGIAFAVYRLVK